MSEEQIRELLRRFQEGEEEAGETLFRQMEPLVKAYALRMTGRAGERDDYFQAGMMGLLKAAQRFNPARGVKFITFALSWIEGEMRLYRRRTGFPLKVSRSMLEQSRRLNSCREQLMQALHREPTVGEIADVMGIASEDVALVMESSLPLAPLEEEALADGEGMSEEEKLLERLALGEGMMKLTPLERQLIVLRFFDELTQAETAGRLALSQRQVSRFEKRILRQLRFHMQPEV
ncbi:MAG TPA: sigma-70 family RNA polymerase sigma factor [Bacillota bacterium]|jgi:RNA polymerase sporulation-specific sigma factor|nr:sigma-70 family RNA polymerase sigma factor [Bacillota bacterium]HOA35340.1 sigma-70 family RNA polymerase sigma factor [Bacillota bacterium]HOJ83584.1 sigma-70 family RNA polymerase sigma factor [Bacillota bacterium]HOL15551.1 sigma-70 family RNA polymerase sigma factor [Bacillota bacterium]HPZ11040.1 sigma-70 family RNA polymerase sigma factor [Bacillota bacterium]